MALVGFGGSRSLGSAWAGLVGRVVVAVARAGRNVAVCSGVGASAFVRRAYPSALVFSPSFSGHGALPVRASNCVRACAAAEPGSAWVAFVSGPCPARHRPRPFLAFWPSGLGLMV